MQTLNQVADAAENLLILPTKLSLDYHAQRSTIQERFDAFHAANPGIYNLLVMLARDVKSRGYNRYSMKAVYERARWHYQIEKGNRDFKLNNDFTAPYARLIMSQESDLDGFFETRQRNHECN